MCITSTGYLVLVLTLHSYQAMRLSDIADLKDITSYLHSTENSIHQTLTSRNLTLINIKGSSFTELSIKYGHPAEEHEVTTEDGYKVTVFRLPGRRKALPILLFHGLGDSSDTFIIRGTTSLAIALANAEYDVWLANNRGNRYSRGHAYLSPDDPAYWNFSFHEIGIYDLSATIDLVLNKTGAEKLNAFGHSQGNIIFYTLLSTRTEYNAKVNVLTALAPICYLQNVPPPIGTIMKVAPLIYPIIQGVGLTNVLGDDSVQTTIFRILSQIPVLGHAIVGDILFAICGTDREELEPAFIKVVPLYFPTWTAVKDLIHFSQVGVRKVFSQFDYGPKGNKAKYNSSLPPAYDLSKVTAKVVLLAAMNDKFSTLADVAILRRQLPNVVQYIVNPRRQMNHLDYVWGRTAPDYLYKCIFDILNKFS